MTANLAKWNGLSALALAVGMVSVTSPALADNLFERLFGRRPVPQQQQTPPVQQRQQPQRAKQVRAPAAPAPKISAPRIYNYQPQGMVKIDFSGLISSKAEQPNGGAVDPAAISEFAKAAALGLPDYSLFAEKKIAAALAEHYAENPKFIWVDGKGPNAKARQVLRLFDRAAEFGLLEADYVVNVPDDRLHTGNEEQRLKELIRFEMALSARALRYARDANIGRVDPNKLSGFHDFPEKPLREARVLEVLAEAAKPGDYLQSLHPKNELYSALLEELKTLRAASKDEIVVDPKTFVRPGGSHPEFPKIVEIIKRDADAEFRAEHGALLAAYDGSDAYAPELVPVIEAAQKLHDLNPDGVIGPRTVHALAGDTKAARIEKVLLALERLRWHPSYLGQTRVMINAASFTASYIENGAERLTMRTVVGTSRNQTNFFHDEIEYVEFNPYWGVPRSILVNEKLPRLRRDPGYLDRAGYEVTDSRGRRVSSASINWSRYGANIPYSVRQKPGPSNALGELKIMFPNKNDIYMHDTPARELFSRDTRAYSHGCVRLQDPRAMAAAVLGTSVEDIASEVGNGRNSRRNVPFKIPVYVGYFTAWPEPAGSISYHPDIYERDANLRKALAKIEEVRASGS